MSPVVHIIPGLGRSQGGPSYSVPRLCSALREAGTVVQLCTVETPADPPLASVEADRCRHDFSYIPVLRNLRASRSLRVLLENVVPHSTAVHVHGIWLMPNVYAGEIAERWKRPLVVSPRGMLAPQALQFSRARKMLFWRLLQQKAYAKAAVWHATCEAEAEEIRQFGIRAPITVIPNGVDLPEAGSPQSTSWHADEMKTLLYLGRIHPKKGLKSLVEAWAPLSAKFRDWRLRIAGPDEGGHRAELESLAEHFGAQRMSVEPPLFGSLKDKAFSEASLFVLPTLNENFGIAVAEALAMSIPAIVTKGAPWSMLETERCGWWIDHGVGPLTDALRIAMQTSPVDLRDMGQRGRALVTRDFSWSRIGHEMSAVYSWIAHGGPTPSTIRLH